MTVTTAQRDLASAEIWERSLERSRYRRALAPKARRERGRKKHVSAALATAVVAGPSAPLAAAQLVGSGSASVAAASPANRAIEVRDGGLPLMLGSQGDLVAHVQRAHGVSARCNDRHAPAAVPAPLGRGAPAGSPVGARPGGPPPMLGGQADLVPTVQPALPPSARC